MIAASPRLRGNALIALILRIALSIQILGACFAVRVPDPASAGAWLQLQPGIPHAISWTIVIALAMACVALLIGYATRFSAMAAGLILVVIEVQHLVSDPFYNVTEAIGILLAMVVAILLLSDSGPILGVDDLRRTGSPKATAWSHVSLLVRLFVGAVFVFQGWKNMVGSGGLVEFARKVYVVPFHGRLPDSLLWIAGTTNPPWEFAGGCLLIAGLFTTETALGMSLFLLIIIFGHVLQDKGAATAAMRDYALANLFAVLGVLWLKRRGNTWSVDAFWKRGAGTA